MLKLTSTEAAGGSQNSMVTAADNQNPTTAARENQNPITTAMESQTSMATAADNLNPITTAAKESQYPITAVGESQTSMATAADNLNPITAARESQYPLTAAGESPIQFNYNSDACNQQDANHDKDKLEKLKEESMEISIDDQSTSRKSTVSILLNKITVDEEELTKLYIAALKEIKGDPSLAPKVLEIEEKLQCFHRYYSINQKRKDMAEPTDGDTTESRPHSKKICQENELTLLLLGSAGNGKSATGNSILGKTVFKTSASTSSNTSECQKGTAVIGSDTMTVLDCPGIDTENSPEVVFHSFVESVKQALELCKYTFSAVVIVLKYGQRFTKQESETIKHLKGILGKDVLKDRGICVVTHGDNFEADTEDENVDFIDWCQEQGGDIKTLFDECNFHCVLFNNKTKSQDTKNDQLTRLLQYVPRAKPYTEKDFISAFKDLNKMKLEYEVPKIIEETNAFIKSKRQKLQEIDSETDESQRRVQLEQIKDDIAQYNHNLLESTGDEEMMKQPLQSLKIFSLEVNAKLKMCQEKRKIIGIEHKDIDASQSQTEEKRPLQLVATDHFSTLSATASADLQDALMTDSVDSNECVSIKPSNHSCDYL